MGEMGRDEVIKRIRTALKKRSGKSWSVTGGSGTAWGWIHISSPPKRRVGSFMSEEDQAELASLLDLNSTRPQYVSVPASSNYRMEFVARAEGRTPETYGTQYWD